MLAGVTIILKNLMHSRRSMCEKYDRLNRRTMFLLGNLLTASGVNTRVNVFLNVTVLTIVRSMVVVISCHRVMVAPLIRVNICEWIVTVRGHRSVQSTSVVSYNCPRKWCLMLVSTMAPFRATVITLP